jgi:hypothetical protein
VAEIFTFPGSSDTKATMAAMTMPDAGPGLTRGERLYGPHRSREAVQRDIEAHVTARRAYGQVAWVAAAEAEGLPAANIEAARQDTARLYAEMQDAARHLVICMPTDPKALVDLLMYLEKHFSILPQEIWAPGGDRFAGSRSTASTDPLHEAPAPISPKA